MFLFSMSFLDDWHTSSLSQKSVESQLKAGKKTMVNQITSTEVMLQAESQPGYSFSVGTQNITSVAIVKEYLRHQALIEGEQYMIFFRKASGRFQRGELFSSGKVKKETQSKVADRAMQDPD